MNCKKCGAPIAVEEGQNFFHCQYCGGYDFPDPNQDGVALLGGPSTYFCPVCNEALVSAVFKNVRIFSCSRCRGNLIEQSKMLPILRQAQALDLIAEDQPIPPKQAEFARTFACPSCQKVMATYPYGGSGNIVIQGCAQCRLIWLDFGELSRIIQSYLELNKLSQSGFGKEHPGVVF